MTTKKRLIFAVLALVVVAAGCTSPDVAATVNDREIHDAVVLGLRTGSSGDAVVSGEEFRSDLTRLIFTHALLSAAEEDFGITGLETYGEREGFIATATPEEQMALVSVSQDPAFTESALDFAVTQLLVRSKVREALVAREGNLEDIWLNNQDRLVQVCARHIVVMTEEEADAVYERLKDGEDFAALAGEVSFDTRSPGGVLPCPALLSDFDGPIAAAFTAASIGELNPPLLSSFGWHVLILDSLETPGSLEELAQDPMRWIPGDLLDGYWGSWLNEAVLRADVDVRSQIGTWFAPGHGILPPPSSP